MVQCGILISLMPEQEDELKKVKRDLRQRDLKIRELELLITKDPMTGLYNRRGFLEIAEKIFDDIKYHKENKNSPRKNVIIDSFAVLFFDVDHFKKINDTYGHEIGDKILKFVAGIIQSKVRTSDFVGRWGGEEMIAALLGAHEHDAAAKAEEIRKAIKSRVKIPGHPEFKVTISIGVAELDHNPTLEDLIKHGDEAMYQAKQRGRDRVIKYSELKK